MEAEYIARISYGKDSLKMLDVIKSRGLPLDRITTTDVWATDTISANLPPMEAFKVRMDERIWQLYHIEVEHLCARNPDGSRKTYEQMFYHIPVRKSGGGTDRERYADSRTCGIRGVRLDSNGMPMHRAQGTITGYPPNTRYNWCQKLKIVQECNQGVPSCIRDYLLSEAQGSCTDPKDSRRKSLHGAENSKSTRSSPLFF